MTNHWLQVAILLVALCNVYARPKEDVFPVYRSVDASSKESSSSGQITIDDIAIVARASNEDPSMSPSVAKVADQLIDTIGQMVEKDIRTPPKLKAGIKDKNETTEEPVATTPIDKVEANGRFKIQSALTGDSSEGKAASAKKEDSVKGVAVPVIMEEELDHTQKKLQKIPDVEKPQKDDKKKVASTTVKPVNKETPTTTPSSGLSTWILLSDNRDATTPQSSKKKTAVTTTKKPSKTAVTTAKPATSKPAKKTTNKPDKKAEPASALETMVKNKNSATSRPILKRKESESEKRKVTTIPPAILIETTEAISTETTNTESSLETTTKKKKTSTKKRKKNKNRRKKPAEKSGEQEIKDLMKQPKQPVGAQFYNFLSREIMPTVGLGLVGVLVTAGLAGLLGYNPFVGANIPVRRTYETQHGYHPHHNYYNYNSEYPESDGGKNEEVLFREVLSGMPEDSRYASPATDVSYPESQLYNSQEQAYDAAKNPSKKTDTSDGYPDYSQQYDSYTNKEDIGKYPVYSGGSYNVYPEKSTTEKFKASAKYSDETIEKQPEALYRVASGDYTADDPASSDTAWHRIGSPMDYPNQPSPSSSVLEPGPRRLDLNKMTEKLTESHKRSKRSPEGILARIVRRSNEVANLNREDDRDNEIDNDDRISPENTTEQRLESTTEGEIKTQQPSLMESFPSEATPTMTEAPPSLMDVLRKLAQFKLRLGINFLKATTDAFGKYLEGVQQRVEDSYSNDTSLPALRYAWMGRETSSGVDADSRVREKRYQRATDGDASFSNTDQDVDQEN